MNHLFERPPEREPEQGPLARARKTALIVLLAIVFGMTAVLVGCQFWGSHG